MASFTAGCQGILRIVMLLFVLSSIVNLCSEDVIGWWLVRRHGLAQGGASELNHLSGALAQLLERLQDLATHMAVGIERHSKRVDEIITNRSSVSVSGG